MSLNRHALKRPDGSISVLICPAGVDEDAEIARLLALPDYAGCAPLGRQALPASRRFRDCWRHDGAAVGVDLPSARAQRLAEVRAERDALLAASDVLSIKTMESGVRQDQIKIAAYKQSLRDLPTAVSADVAKLATPEDLAAYAPPWPLVPALA